MRPDDRRRADAEGFTHATHPGFVDSAGPGRRGHARRLQDHDVEHDADQHAVVGRRVAVVLAFLAVLLGRRWRFRPADAVRVFERWLATVATVEFRFVVERRQSGFVGVRAEPVGPILV
jgi:hypothetical protein